MRFIRDLSRETQRILKRIYKESRHHQVRQRAHCILLSFQGLTMNELIAIFKVSRKTLYNWLTAWEDEKLVGLYERAGRGRKPKLKEEQKEQIREWVKAEPKNLKKILGQVEREWNIRISKDTLKRVLKEFQMTWKRLKRGVSRSPWDWEYEIKLEKLESLKEQEKRQEIDLRYLDESGFCLTPYLPYGWQEKGETILVKSGKSRRINVLGILNRKNELDWEVYLGKMTSERLIRYLDKFSERLEKKTVVVMDQSPVHTSDAVMKKLEEWASKNLEIFWLPPYSPELNLIEILWKFMKYEWIEIEAYRDWKSLVKYVKNVLKKVGTEYVINFA
ncbi:IS630 family transposase [Coleofasciculus sp. FACHB-64]|uniref:IS630 family transposase n=4 Tax=Bacteria TaxID=2 RepID=UPI001684DB95|nr:IS630 family transposase [Coleofasciculus sp. FACHB-64]MBD2045344.1 IS630 family transposase [Coleofasciculus sp. FACHB-64]